MEKSIKDKISKSLRGRKPWNAGKTLSENYKKKIKISCQGINMGKKNGNWNGGRTMSKEGYIYVKTPSHCYANACGYVPEHRIVIERHIKRLLKPEEVIHHLNLDKSDNKIGNLMLFKNQKEHLKFHNKIKQFGYTKPIIKQINNRWNEFKEVK